MSYLTPEAIKAAQLHALSEYPRESCGLVVAGEYIPCANTAEDPEKDFRIDPKEYLQHTAKGIQAIIHSHPSNDYSPSAADMNGQINTGVVWGIIATDGERATEPMLWGDQLPISSLIGRPFVHGTADCFSLIRDAFRIGKEGMAEQGMPDWPFDPITFPVYPRDDAWWNGQADMYTDNMYDLGWREIRREDVKPGDAFLLKVRSDKLNHAGLYVGNNLILHHLPTRLSRREPAGVWANAADIWVRWENKNAS